MTSAAELLTFPLANTEETVDDAFPNLSRGQEDAATNDGVCFVTRLDSLTVSFGAAWKDQLETASDLILGDAFTAPDGSQFPARVDCKTDNVSTIRWIDDVQVGPGELTALGTHDVTLMDANGRVIHGRIMSVQSTALGSDFLVSHAELKPKTEYTLVDIRDARPMPMAATISRRDVVNVG